VLTAHDIYLQYGDRILFDHISLSIGEREKAGLVGRNGAGKSTLMRILAGFQRPDEGKVSRPASSSLNYLHQDIVLPKGKTVLEEAMTAFEALRELEGRIEEANRALAERTDYESPEYARVVQDLADAQDRFRLLGGDKAEANTEIVLKGLGFASEDFGKNIETFSGGWQMRVELAKMLLRQPDYLFLDEPTNHLDIESIIWLEQYLREYPGTVVVISHDKQFLNNVTERTLEVELGKLYDYKASYSKFEELKQDRLEKQESAYRNQQRVIAEKERTINRFMAKATKTKMAQSMQKQLDKLERVELEAVDLSAMRISFPPAPRSGQVVLEAHGLSKHYGEKVVLENIDFKIDRGDRIAFVGQNGQGKTTRARILVKDLETSGGELKLGHNVHLGYYAQDQSEALHPKLTLLETLEREAPPELQPKLRSILGAFMFSGEDVHKKVSVLSGGERARLALAALLLKPFNLLVLDEPTNHLDMISKEVLKNALKEYDGTLIIVSHDRDFLAGLSSRTIEFRDRRLHEYLGDVNFFLGKREMDDMREVEKRSEAGSSESSFSESSQKEKRKVDHQERKKLQRAVQKAEKTIEKLEDQLAEIEIEMARPEFYESENSQETLNQYADLKKQLEVAMEEWEEAHEAWELIDPS
jgi:ATP-binding cassette subfamily F protein 3